VSSSFFTHVLIYSILFDHMSWFHCWHVCLLCESACYILFFCSRFNTSSHMYVFCDQSFFFRLNTFITWCTLMSDIFHMRVVSGTLDMMPSRFDMWHVGGIWHFGHALMLLTFMSLLIRTRCFVRVLHYPCPRVVSIVLMHSLIFHIVHVTHSLVYAVVRYISCVGGFWHIGHDAMFSWHVTCEWHLTHPTWYHVIDMCIACDQDKRFCIVSSITNVPMSSLLSYYTQSFST